MLFSITRIYCFLQKRYIPSIWNDFDYKFNKLNEVYLILFGKKAENSLFILIWVKKHLILKPCILFLRQIYF